MIILLNSCGSDFQESDGMIRTKSLAGKFGFKNSAGEQIVDNIFTDATDFKNGISIITQDNLQGTIDKKGRIILEPKYARIEFVDNSYIKVCQRFEYQNSLCSVYDVAGKEIIPMVVGDVFKVYDSKYFECSMNGVGTLRCLFDLDGRKVTDSNYDEVDTYAEDIVIMRKTIQEKTYSRGRESEYKIYDLTNPKAPINNLEKFRFVQLFNPKENRNSFLFKGYKNEIFDIKGKSINAFKKYSDVRDYGEGLFVVENKDYLKGYADREGNLKFNFVFIGAGGFENGKAKVTIGGGSDFYIDKNGKCLENCPSEKLLAYQDNKGWLIDKSEYKKLIRLGLKQMDYKNYDKAVEYFTESIKSFSMDYEAYYNRGICNFMEDNIEASLKDFNIAIELDSENPNLYYLRGSAYQKNNEMFNATRDFEKSIELNPYNSDPYMKLAIVYGKSGDKIKSCSFMSKACELGNNEACNGYDRFCR